MSDYIPFEIQINIMEKLPIKSLIQFRSVSKQWKSLIDSSEFITNYHLNNSQPKHHIFISYVDPKDFEKKYVSIVDDATFPQNKSIRTAPANINYVHNPYYKQKVIGSSQGLFCFYSYYGKPNVNGTAVIWNPTIRKSVVINVPNVSYQPYETVVGFCVCPRTNDPKLVKITFIKDVFKIDQCKPWKVEVYTVSSGVWRTPSIDLPSKTISLYGDQEVLDGFIYFLSSDRPTLDGVIRCNYLIMSFDMISEEFTKICVPGCFNLNSFMYLTMSKLQESLVLIAYAIKDVRKVYDVWMMEHGVTKSFKKVLSIDPQDINSRDRSLEKVIGFRKSGEAIIVMQYDDDKFAYVPDDDWEDYVCSLIAYEPYSKHMDTIGISGKTDSFFANCYMETLLLLDH